MIDTSLYNPICVRQSIAWIKVVDANKKEWKHKKELPCYTVAKITYEEYDDGQYIWYFEPLWNRIDNAPERWRDMAQTSLIGFDYDLRKKKYKTTNRLPSFVYQRTPTKERDDAMHLMNEAGLNYFDYFDYMVKCRYICGSDFWIVDDDANDSEDGWKLKEVINI